MWPGTNGPQEKFAVLQHAAACFFFFFNEAAIVLQQYESISGSKYTLRTYHSFFPCLGQVLQHAAACFKP